MLNWLARHPGAIVVSVVLIIAAAIVVAVLSPLISVQEAKTAELAGNVPAEATVGQQIEFDLSYDNTGTLLISPVCVGVSVVGPLQPQYALFLSVDRVAYRDGEVCGGALGGGEPVSIKLFVTATGPGMAHIQLTPAQGVKAVGPPLSGSIVIR